jgi:hypothetical protein
MDELCIQVEQGIQQEYMGAKHTQTEGNEPESCSEELEQGALVIAFKFTPVNQRVYNLSKSKA